VFLYHQPTADEARNFDVIINVAREVSNPFKAVAEQAAIDRTDEAEPAKPTYRSIGVQVELITENTVNRVTGLGSQSMVSNCLSEVAAMEKLSIDEEPDTPKPSLKEPEYIHLPWEHNSKVYEEWLDICELIDDRVRRGQKVLIHCQLGVSRSASLIVAYGIFKNPNLSPDEAREQAKQKSRWIDLNMHFMYELGDFKKLLVTKHHSNTQAPSQLAAPNKLSRSKTDTSNSGPFPAILDASPSSSPGQEPLSGPVAAAFHPNELKEAMHPVLKKNEVSIPSSPSVSKNSITLPTAALTADVEDLQSPQKFYTPTASSFADSVKSSPSAKTTTFRDTSVDVASSAISSDSAAVIGAASNHSTAFTPMRSTWATAPNAQASRLQQSPQPSDPERIPSQPFTRMTTRPLSMIQHANEPRDYAPLALSNVPKKQRPLRTVPSLPAGFSNLGGGTGFANRPRPNPSPTPSWISNGQRRVSGLAVPTTPSRSENIAPQSMAIPTPTKRLRETPSLPALRTIVPPPNANTTGAAPGAKDSPDLDTLWSPRAQEFTANPFSMNSLSETSSIARAGPQVVAGTGCLNAIGEREREMLADGGPTDRELLDPGAMVRDPRSPPVRGEGGIMRSIDDLI